MITVQSSSQADYSGTSADIPKPSGLAVGDLMVACLHVCDGNSINTKSGWTLRQTGDGTNNDVSIQTKIADSGDVAASNFTFTSSSGNLAGAILRIDGHAPNDHFDVADNDVNNTQQAPSFTYSLTPSYDNALIVAVVGVSVADPISGLTLSSYTNSGTDLSWTEIAEQSVTYSGSEGGAFSVIHAPLATARELTSLTADDGAGGTPGRQALAIASFIPQVDASGSVELVEDGGEVFTPTGSCGASGTVELVEDGGEVFSVTGKASSRVWTNESRPSGTWTNETRP